MVERGVSKTLGVSSILSAPVRSNIILGVITVEQKNQITLDFLKELLAANNKEFFAVLNLRDESPVGSEKFNAAQYLSGTESAETMVLLNLINYCEGKFTKEDVFRILTENHKATPTAKVTSAKSDKVVPNTTATCPNNDKN